MLSETIEFKNPVYGLVKKVKSKSPKKIKFKPASFERISSKWRKFWTKILDKKLDKAKEKLVSTEIPAYGFESGLGGASRGDKKILRRAKSVAKLESKINFLRTGERMSRAAVASRAIKLKSNMKNNMEFNCDYVYSVLPENAAKIFEQEPVNNENPISNNKTNEDEIQNKVAASVQKIMAEKQQAKGNGTVQTDPVQPNREEIKNTVDEIFAEQEKAKNNNINTPVAGTVDKNEIMNEINNAENKVKVSTNKSKAAKINPFIQEDGTYHIKGTDIDDELRYTHVDLKNYNYTPKFNNQQVGVGEISPIESFKASFEDLTMPKKAEINTVETGLNDDIFGQNMEKDELPEKLESDRREIPIVAPERNKQSVDKFKIVDKTDTKQVQNEKSVEKTTSTEENKKQNGNLHFDYSNASVQDLTNAVDKVTNMDEISALLNRVKTLQKEKERTQAEAEEAEKGAEASKTNYEETVNKFRAYGNSLEAACNENLQKAQKSRDIQRVNEQKIQMMAEAMGSVVGEMATVSSGKGK